MNSRQKRKLTAFIHNIPRYLIITYKTREEKVQGRQAGRNARILLTSMAAFSEASLHNRR